MRCSRFQVDWPWRTSNNRVGEGFEGRGGSGGCGRANPILISILALLVHRSVLGRSRETTLQSHGTLAEITLRSLLESAQGERSTGTLTLRNGNGESTALYFLFGHLFHADGNGKAGDDAVVTPLCWTKGEFEFDAKAKLPADETVKAGIPEVVHAAEATPRDAPSPAPPQPSPQSTNAEALPHRAENPKPERKLHTPHPTRAVTHIPQPHHPPT